jgi:hypothetical protein
MNPKIVMVSAGFYIIVLFQYEQPFLCQYTKYTWTTWGNCISHNAIYKIKNSIIFSLLSLLKNGNNAMQISESLWTCLT